MSPWCFRGRRLLLSSFHLANLKNLFFFLYGNFVIVLCANALLICRGVNYVCKVLKLNTAIKAKQM